MQRMHKTVWKGVTWNGVPLDARETQHQKLCIAAGDSLFCAAEGWRPGHWQHSATDASLAEPGCCFVTECCLPGSELLLQQH